HSQRLLIMMRMSPRSFVDTVDFVTSPGHAYRSKRGAWPNGQKNTLPGGGPMTVITDLGVCDFQNGEMVLTEIYEGVEIAQVKAACGWDLKVASQLKKIAAPSAVQISLLRDKLDPQRLYL
ncbi:CoA-transferase subunit beta, partial [bacterium]|nr:CoA-transferase subunit beta [bacterium]